MFFFNQNQEINTNCLIELLFWEFYKNRTVSFIFFASPKKTKQKIGGV